MVIELVCFTIKQGGGVFMNPQFRVAKAKIQNKEEPDLLTNLLIEIDNEVSVIMQHAQEIKHTSENVSNEVKNYTKELNEQLDTWSRENFLTNLINNIKAIGKENFGSSRNIEQSALRIDRAIKQLKKQE